MTSDRMIIKGIRGFGHHGVHSIERRAGQEFFVDLALDLDLRDASESDDLMDTLDYSVLARRVADLVGVDPKDALNLIEALAGRVAAACLEDDRVSAVEVTVHKPQAPVGVPVSDIAVQIRRTRADVQSPPGRTQ